MTTNFVTPEAFFQHLTQEPIGSSIERFAIHPLEEGRRFVVQEMRKNTSWLGFISSYLFSSPAIPETNDSKLQNVEKLVLLSNQYGEKLSKRQIPDANISAIIQALNYYKKTTKKSLVEDPDLLTAVNLNYKKAMNSLKYSADKNIFSPLGKIEQAPEQFIRELANERFFKFDSRIDFRREVDGNLTPFVSKKYGFIGKTIAIAAKQTRDTKKIATMNNLVEFVEKQVVCIIQNRLNTENIETSIEHLVKRMTLKMDVPNQQKINETMMRLSLRLHEMQKIIDLDRAGDSKIGRLMKEGIQWKKGIKQVASAIGSFQFAF